MCRNSLRDLPCSHIRVLRKCRNPLQNVEEAGDADDAEDAEDRDDGENGGESGDTEMRFPGGRTDCLLLWKSQMQGPSTRVSVEARRGQRRSVKDLVGDADGAEGEEGSGGPWTKEIGDAIADEYLNPAMLSGITGGSASNFDTSEGCYKMAARTAPLSFSVAVSHLLRAPVFCVGNWPANGASVSLDGAPMPAGHV
eukprot:gene15186-biopygen10074